MSRSSPLIFRGTDDWHCFCSSCTYPSASEWVGFITARRADPLAYMCLSRVLCFGHVWWARACMLRFTGCQPPQGWVSLVERGGDWLKTPRPSHCTDPGPADQVPSESGEPRRGREKEGSPGCCFLREEEVGMGGKLVSVWLPLLEVWPDRVLKPGSRGLCRINDLFFPRDQILHLNYY